MGIFSMNFVLGLTLGPPLGAQTLSYFGARTLWVGCLVVGGMSAFLLARIKQVAVEVKPFQ